MSEARSGMPLRVILYRAILLVWFLVYLFHASRNSLLDLDQLAALRFLGGLSEAHRMAQSVHYSSAADAFGEHAVFLFCFFLVVSAAIPILFIRQALAIAGLVPTPRLSRMFMLSVSLAFLALSFTLLSHDFTLFFGNESRTSGGFFGLKLLIYSVMWPMLAVACIEGVINPERSAG